VRIFGLEISRAKAAGSALVPGGGEVPLSPIDMLGGWFPIIREASTGDWQRNVGVAAANVLSSVWVFRCISLISGDIGKLNLTLKKLEGDIWVDTTSSAFSPVLAKPNAYQNRIQFVESWIISKLCRGNAYIYKERDNRNVVVALHVLHPDLVHPLVAPDGSVYYQLARDLLAGVPDLESDLPAVPASEMIHDRWNCLYHPLVGLSPIYACAMTALQNIGMQQSMTQFFRNGARPGGVLTAPGHIADDTAARLKQAWDDNFSGINSGKVAVLGDGLEFKGLMMTATDAQLLEQLKFSGQTICGAFGVPSYMVNLDKLPQGVSVEAMAQMYYSQCLQTHIESMELCLSDGLALPTHYAAGFDLDGLLRMDQAAQITALVEGIKGGMIAPNEGRQRIDLPAVEGGDTPYMQQQNFSLAALAKRDADEPFAKPAPATSPAGYIAEPDQPAAQPADTAGGTSPSQSDAEALAELDANKLWADALRTALKTEVSLAA
jgi:HK97 family phage portal protein